MGRKVHPERGTVDKTFTDEKSCSRVGPEEQDCKPSAGSQREPWENQPGGMASAPLRLGSGYPKIAPIDRGLVIRQPWAEMVVRGQKTWEIRGKPTRIRGDIAIIAAGSGSIIGTCRIISVRGPLSSNEYALAYTERGEADVDSPEMPYLKTYAWVLDQARRLKSPIPYLHPKGAVIWVRLSEPVQAALQVGLMA